MAPAVLLPNGSNGVNHGKKPFTILVTGFGPFMQQFPVNPSFEIAKRLPKTLSEKHSQATVRIIAYESPVNVVFEDVRKLVPQLHDEYRGEVDFVLHIGMASGRKFYAIERFAHRDGYSKNKDLDGKMPDENAGEVLFGDCPRTMTTSLDYDTVLSNWKSNIADQPKGSAGHASEVLPSYDAGHYLCDYIYFNSLAYFARKSSVYEGGQINDRPVLFLHVPAESDEESLARGTAVTISLLEAIADACTIPAQNGHH